MRAKIIAIGISKGVEVDDTGAGILIRPIKKSRKGWAKAFKKIAGSAHDKIIEMPESEWDEKEWRG